MRNAADWVNSEGVTEVRCAADETVLALGFDENELERLGHVFPREIVVCRHMTDVIALPARLVLLKKGPTWEQEKDLLRGI